MTTIRELLKTDDLTNLALIFKNPSLKILDLQGSGDATEQAIKDVRILSNYNTAKLLEALQENDTIAWLDLSRNLIGSEKAVRSIASFIEVNTSVSYIDLELNMIDYNQAKLLTKALEKNYIIKKFKLNFSCYSGQNPNEIHETIKQIEQRNIDFLYDSVEFLKIGNTLSPEQAKTIKASIAFKYVVYEKAHSQICYNSNKIIEHFQKDSNDKRFCEQMTEHYEFMKKLTPAEFLNLDLAECGSLIHSDLKELISLKSFKLIDSDVSTSFEDYMDNIEYQILGTNVYA